jgi:hypothetical protein
MMKMNETEFKTKADELFKEIENKARNLKEGHTPFIERILTNIEEAKSLFRDGKIPESFKKYNEVLIDIQKAEASIGAEPLVRKLFCIEITYLIILLLLGYLTFKCPNFSLWRDLINIQIQCVWFGALGGVTIAFYGIYTHFQARDFDPKYSYWYYCKPIMGGIFGWFIYLIYFVGLISVQNLSEAKIQNPQVPFVIAFLAGFSERFSIKMVDKLMSVLTTWKEKTGESKST